MRAAASLEPEHAEDRGVGGGVNRPLGLAGGSGYAAEIATIVGRRRCEWVRAQTESSRSSKNCQVGGGAGVPGGQGCCSRVEGARRLLQCGRLLTARTARPTIGNFKQERRGR